LAAGCGSDSDEKGAPDNFCAFHRFMEGEVEVVQ